tara:strand:- start:224 stop:475 length:252 start_codon:yes stop_codon:yes gene_type:complete
MTKQEQLIELLDSNTGDLIRSERVLDLVMEIQHDLLISEKDWYPNLSGIELVKKFTGQIVEYYEYNDPSFGHVIDESYLRIQR